MGCVALLASGVSLQADASPITSQGSGKPAAAGLSLRNQKLRAIDSLKALQSAQVQQMEAIDLAVDRLLRETQTISLAAPDATPVEKQINGTTARLSQLQSQRDEAFLRRDLYGQLLFRLDTKWTGSRQNTQNLNEFFSQELLEMAKTEIAGSSAEGSVKVPSSMWRFFVYLSIAIREIPDRREDPVEFVKSFTEFSSIRNAKSPLAYLDSRNYTNGAQSQAARPMKRDDIGRILEAQLKQLPPARPAASSADIELRTSQPSSQSPTGASESREVNLGSETNRDSGQNSGRDTGETDRTAGK